MALSQDFLIELHDRNDIVEVVNSYVPLTRRGRIHVALCPFHNEKTPSFTVYPDTQSFYCFGCGAGGDVITFIKQRENIEYIEAVKLLANRAGMALPDETDTSAIAIRKRIFEINKLSARFFFDSLNSDAGKHARGYLRRRGLDDATIRRFGIGYADDTWDSLRNFLRSKGYRDEEMIEAGVCTAGKNGGSYDFFRERAMFPVIDVRGNIVAFSGRTLGDDSRKYLNTRDTAVFKKSRTLFALNIAKNTKTRQIIIAEGQMDVIALHAAGFDNAVAGLGTALTDEHARMISQYADEVLLAYDSDEAGQKAVRRTTETFKSTNLTVRVISMTGAKDPDEFIQKFGVNKFSELIESSSSSTEYELFRVKKNFDLETDLGRTSYLKASGEVLARIDSLTERDIYAGRVAKETGGNKEYLLLEAERVRKILRAKETKEQDAKLSRSVSERYNMRTASDSRLGTVSAEQFMIALLFYNPDLCERVTERLLPTDFSSEETSEIYRLLTEVIGREEFTGMPSMSAVLSDEQMSLLCKIIAERPSGNFAIDDSDLYIDRIVSAANEPTTEDLRQMDAEKIQKLIDKKKGIKK